MTQLTCGQTDLNEEELAHVAGGANRIYRDGEAYYNVPDHFPTFAEKATAVLSHNVTQSFAAGAAAALITKGVEYAVHQ